MKDTDYILSMPKGLYADDVVGEQASFEVGDKKTTGRITKYNRESGIAILTIKIDKKDDNKDNNTK